MPTVSRKSMASREVSKAGALQKTHSCPHVTQHSSTWSFLHFVSFPWGKAVVIDLLAWLARPEGKTERSVMKFFVLGAVGCSGVVNPQCWITLTPENVKDIHLQGQADRPGCRDGFLIAPLNKTDRVTRARICPNGMRALVQSNSPLNLIDLHCFDVL